MLVVHCACTNEVKTVSDIQKEINIDVEVKGAYILLEIFF